MGGDKTRTRTVRGFVSFFNPIFHCHRRARFQLPSTTNTTNHQHLINNDLFNEYQFYTENSVLNAALNRLISPISQTTTSNSNDETRAIANEGVSIVSAPKNVKFIIPLGRSGIASNESTFGVIESTTRTITHVKDIFPLNTTSQPQATTTTMANNGDEPGLRPDQHGPSKADSEQQKNDSNPK